MCLCMLCLPYFHGHVPKRQSDSERLLFIKVKMKDNQDVNIKSPMLSLQSRANYFGELKVQIFTDGVTFRSVSLSCEMRFFWRE